MGNSLDRPNHKPKDETSPSEPKNHDPYIFKPAEWFFKEIENGTKQPQLVSLIQSDQEISGKPNPVCSHGRIFRFNDGLGYLLIQFMRPQVWRIRFHESNKQATDFTDYNTRTIVQDTLTSTIQVLDKAEDISWHVELVEPNNQYYVLQSVIDQAGSTARHVAVQLWIRRNPFKITAIRAVRAVGSYTQLPEFVPPYTANDSIAQQLQINKSPDSRLVVVWRTKDKPLQYLDNATILAVEKPLSAKYTGFGEQGGNRLFKDNLCMNYFNYDNMRYYNVYDNGPLEDGEPLYHSEPYWIEMNALPGAWSQLATFVDNYSDVKLDLGKTDATRLRIATRFNSFQAIFIAGDDIAQIIRSYTSLLGRPQLKPRYVLGNHQGCYGYDTQGKVENAVQKYRDYQIPLDGMHIDVDMQRDYRTFTIDTSPSKFPNPEQMFDKLRQQGVKCSTNITPVINARDDANYSTLNDGLQKDCFVKDVRDIDPSADSAWSQRYLYFGKGNRFFKNPNEAEDREKYDPPDYGYDFSNCFNSKKPFRGGVGYGDGRGCPGYYPNLNNEAVRVWWGQQYDYLFRTGLEFVWQDMTSPCMARGFGDMLSWPFRLMLDSDGWSGDPNLQSQKKAIEIWSLYSYNLHKATFHGLQRMDHRKGKRNFIIGRGSFAGAQRFAGLWTGDNVSSWDFFDVSVAQVLALGLAGVTISGADVGGFEPVDDVNHAWCDPELLIRWYGAYSLLPWFRNHYSAKPGKKLFQEPFAYRELQDSEYWKYVPQEDHYLYYSVLPACRYIIQLRYSLLQLMYDAMFENMINGLPIARAMIITDPMDASLYQSNQWYTRSQYLVRNDLLVAPALYRKRNIRKLYLPAPDDWYPLNLRPGTTLEGRLAEPLLPKIAGGTYVNYDCHIAPEEAQLPYITPMFVREGGIIPQVSPHDHVPDRTRHDAQAPPNPLTINIYPGKDNTYEMFLDDGVSRDSAPDNAYLSTLARPDDPAAGRFNAAWSDDEAKSNFRKVVIKQTTTRVFAADLLRDLRSIKITTPWSKYTDAQVKRDVGPVYRIAIWYASRWPAAEVDLNTVYVKVNGVTNPNTHTDHALRATFLEVPIEANVVADIEVSYPA